MGLLFIFLKWGGGGAFKRTADNKIERKMQYLSDDRFVMAARVGNRQFAGVTCHNKKDGRKEAADVALRTLIAEGQYSAASPTPSVRVFLLIGSFLCHWHLTSVQLLIFFGFSCIFLLFGSFVCVTGVFLLIVPFSCLLASSSDWLFYLCH